MKGDTVAEETLLTPASASPVAVRELVAPTRIEIERLAVIFDHYRVHYGEAADPSRTASWLASHLAGGITAFVAHDDGEFIGFALVMDVPASQRLGHFWQIRDLFVVPTQRRIGVGRSLLEFIRAAAISAGASRLALQTETDNTSALRLYEGLGFTSVDGYRSLSLPLETRGQES